MALNLSENKGKLIQASLLMILPFLLILLGLGISVQNAWYYILAITWFASGIIFYLTLN